MGKVLSAFLNGWPGAISRAVDDIVIALPNQDTAPIPYGTPVFLSTDRSGAVKATTSQEADTFLGFAVRSAAKTPDTYGANVSEYAPGEMMDILTRGSVLASVPNGSPKRGLPVYLVLATGELSASAGSEGANIALPNCVFRAARDTENVAEILVSARNLL